MPAALTNYFPSFHRERIAGTDFYVLANANGTMAAPVIDGMVFFNEADFFSEQLLRDRMEELTQQLAQNELKYERFVRQKGRRPNVDIYASFQPFNEAFKAFFPFIKTLRKRLSPGDTILNLWDRTGYTACLLAGIFPDQKIINLWEGDKDTLGYKGFRFWYNEAAQTERPVQIAFADLNASLPFEDESVALVVGLDTFHRFDQARLLSELYRVVSKSGAMLFPHVHLTNSEPEPFFERGCRQLHGTDYAAFFDATAAKSGRKGYLLPEPEMFLFNELSGETERQIFSDPTSSHYNSSIAILPEKWEQEETLQPFGLDDLTDPVQARVLINPLVEIDWSQQRVWQNPDRLAGQVGYLLERHPVYLKKLVTEESLDDQSIKILYWAGRLLTIAEISARLQLDHEAVISRLSRLQELDIVQVVPLSEQHLRLQYFVSTQHYHVPYAEQHLAALWERAQRHFPEQPYIFSEVDGSELTYAEADELVGIIRQRLVDDGLKSGDHLLLVGRKHFEGILSIHAATHLGVIVVPLDVELAPELIEQITNELSPSLILTDQLHAGRLKTLKFPIVQFDEEDADDDIELFSDWLEETEALPLKDMAQSPGHDDVACVLFTSGSTGRPKGVPLTHGQLYRSGRLITETFHWSANDLFFSPGELDSMSGFRNYCIAPLEVGAGIVLSDPAKHGQLFGLVETIEQYKVTLLGTTPALLAQFLRYHKRVKPDLASLETVICTGSNLAPEVKQRCQSLFGWVPLNYYGLTETTGLCLSEDPENVQLESNTVGVPRAAIAQIVDDSGKIVARGEQGELRIYSENLAADYLGKQTDSLIHAGWLYTGDIARWHENGHLALMGRSRQIIKLASGQLVFASEVENHLMHYTDLVTNAAVTGFVDDDIEKIVAFIQPKDTDADQEMVRRELQQSIIDGLGVRKVPHRWFFLERLPANSSGKIQKQRLVEQHLSQ